MIYFGTEIPDVYLNVLIAVFGLIIGSFLNVVIARLPDRKSLVSPPSACPKCGYALRWYDNVPVLSYLGPACALAMTGSFVVERVFFIPGMGQHFVNAVQNKDLFLLIGVVLVFATLLILLNLAVDVLYRWVDPRIQ